MNPATTGAPKFTAQCVERELFAPNRRRRTEFIPHERSRIVKGELRHYRLSMSLMYAERTRALLSALPAARRILFGCQSIERTVDRIGFLRGFATHQSFSTSNEHTAIALTGIFHELPQPRRDLYTANLSPLPTPNLSSLGL